MLVRVPILFDACQVEGFGPDVDRSVEGSIHLRPDSLMELTDGEWNFIQKKYPDVFNKLQFIAKSVKPAKSVDRQKVQLSPIEEKVHKNDSQISRNFGKKKEKV